MNSDQRRIWKDAYFQAFFTTLTERTEKNHTKLFQNSWCQSWIPNTVRFSIAMPTCSAIILWMKFICSRNSHCYGIPLVNCCYHKQIIWWRSYMMSTYWHNVFITSKLINFLFNDTGSMCPMSHFSLPSPTKMCLTRLLYNLPQGCTNSRSMVAQET